MNIFPLFICKANVGRSQIAQGYFNHVYGFGESLSIAGSEARKEKYSGIPDTTAKNLLKDDYGIDISMQKIKYLSDLSSLELNKITTVVFLYNPTNDSVCDNLCKVNGLSPYEYFTRKNLSIIIHFVADPFEVGIGGYKQIIDQIQVIVDGLKKV